jgi:DNA-binding transcriptional ArsR family regulator
MENETNYLPMEALCKASECLKVLAHPIRLRIIEILMQGQYPVHEIASICTLPAPQTCEHLRLMQSHGLLESVRQGRAVFYKIASPNLPGILECIRKNCAQ